MEDAYLVVFSAADPVARALWDHLGTAPATGERVDGAAVRRLSERAFAVHRPTLHLSDDALERRLPVRFRSGSVPLVFPSVHRSESGIACLTVHALGNPGPFAELGGRPFAFSPSAPRWMTETLRRVAEEAVGTPFAATFEATHHGPLVALPAFFLEVSVQGEAAPDPAAVRLLARLLPDLAPARQDHVALGVGGGHYAPHFTEVALRRAWSFGHILSRHALEGLRPEVAARAWAETPGAEGVLFARAQDARGWDAGVAGPPRRESDAPGRARGKGSVTSNRGASPGAGT